MISVADYGFLPSATATINQAAMNACLAAVSANARVSIPNGIYDVLPFTIPNKIFTLEGDGNYDVTLRVPASTTGFLFNVPLGVAQFSRLHNLNLVGSDATLTALVYVGNLGLSMENVRMSGASCGLIVAHAVCSEFRNLFCYGSYAGLWLHPESGQVVNKNEFYNIRCALAATGCKIEGGYLSQGNTFVGLDGTNCTTGLYSNGLRNVFVNPWFESCTSNVVDTDTAGSLFVGLHEGPPGLGSSSTHGLTSRRFASATEYVGRSQRFRVPAGVGLDSVYDAPNDFMPIIRATAMHDGAGSRSLVSVAPWSASFGSIIEVRTTQVGSGGIFCRAVGTAKTTGASPTNSIPQAMTADQSSGLGPGTLAWSAASGAATLTYTPESATDTTAIEVCVTQRAGNRLLIQL